MSTFIKVIEPFTKRHVVIGDYDDIIVHPKKGRKEQELPAEAIIVPNPADAAMVVKILQEYGADERFLYNSRLFVDRTRTFCSAGPCLGAPAAGLVLEKLIALGASSITLVSCCGAVDNRLKVGDTVVADSGIVGEGLSAYYGGNDRAVPSEMILLELRQLLQRLQMPWQEGAIWTTDAPYRESRLRLAQLQRQDQVIGVDMEFSALCSIAAFRGIDFGGVFIVSDELWGEQWNPGFASDAYRTARSMIMRGIVAGKVKKTVDDEKNI